MRSRLLLALAACAVLLAGCATQSTTPRTMRDVAYGIADRIANAHAIALDPNKPVLVATAVNMDNLMVSSTFGRTMTELIASRLAQLGVPVSDIRLRNAIALRPEGEMMLSRSAADVTRSYNAQAVVVGTYSVMASNVYVSFKVVRVTDNAVLASADEVIPYAE